MTTRTHAHTRVHVYTHAKKRPEDSSLPCVGNVQTLEIRRLSSLQCVGNTCTLHTQGCMEGGRHYLLEDQDNKAPHDVATVGAIDTHNTTILGVRHVKVEGVCSRVGEKKKMINDRQCGGARIRPALEGLPAMCNGSYVNHAMGVCAHTPTKLRPE